MSVSFVHEGIEVEILEGPYLAAGQRTDEALVFCSLLAANIRGFKHYAAQCLLSLYNEVWFDEDIGTLDESSFVQRLVNPSLYLGKELGTATVYFEDGDIFGGHSIEVTTRGGMPCRAKIAG